MKITPTESRPADLNGKFDCDLQWIELGLEQRMSGQSNVICFETRDPVRVSQVHEYLPSCRSYEDAEVFFYTPWDGLRQHDRGDSSYKEASGSGRSEYSSKLGLNNSSTNMTLKESFQSLQRSMRSKKTVVLLDQVEGLDQTTEVHFNQALRAWATDSQIRAQESVVVVTCSSLQAILDEPVWSHIAVFQAPLADVGERRWMIDRTTQRLGLPFNEPMDRAVVGLAGLNLHQVETTIAQSYFHAKGKGYDLEYCTNLKAQIIRRSNLVEVEEPSWGFESVGGYDAVKDLVSAEILAVLNESQRANERGISLPRGLLLFGPPGTGKTLFAKSLAKELSLPFINFRIENLFSKYLGESGHQFREAIALVEQMSPAVVFVDEIDKMGQRNGGSGDGASQETQKVFGQILEWLGDKRRQSIVVGTTNAPENLDEAFIRPGRFDHIVPFLYPDLKARLEILKIHLGLSADSSCRPIQFQESAETVQPVIEEIAKLSIYFTGAELEEVVKKARIHWFHTRSADQMAASDLYTSFEEYHLDAAARNEQLQRYLSQAERFTRNRRFLEMLTGQFD